MSWKSQYLRQRKEGGTENLSEKVESEIEPKAKTKEGIKCEAEEARHKAKKPLKKKAAKRKSVDRKRRRKWVGIEIDWVLG